MNQPPHNSAPSSVPEASAAPSDASTNPVSVTPHSDPAEMPRFRPSTHAGDIGQLGKYRIQRELGHGGMGAVYLAFDERLQRKVALKVMLPKAAANATAKDRFLREARAAAQISSDYVVNIHEADEIDGIPYIALQYLQGYTLDDYLIKHGNPSIPQIIRIGQETALGLHAAHQLGLIHRDIKPANLWLEAPNGRVKILDFGLARHQSDDIHLTKSGAVVGTPAFMSPEQGRGLPMDGRSDLFSLGGVLYRLCAGRLPFHGDTTMALLMSIGIDDPVLVRDFNPNVPRSLANLIHRLLAKDPGHRPPSAKALADELGLLANTPAAVQDANQLPVVYVPMAIAPVEEQPFAYLTDASSSNDESLAPTQLEVVPPQAEQPFPKLLVGSLLFAVLAIVAAYLIFDSSKKPNPEIVDKGPEVVVPPKVTPTKEPPKVTPTPSKDADLLAAQYVLDLGGAVTVNGQSGMIEARGLLPAERFRLTGVYLLANQSVDDQGLAKFKDCRNLHALRISGTKVTDHGLINFRDYTTLTYLDLSYTKEHITSAGFVNFRNCKCVEYLDLSDTHVDDTAIEIILGMRVLTTLSIRTTKISPEGVKKLIAALPRCKIQYEGGETKPIVEPDRRAAEYVISVGGGVKIDAEDSPYKTIADLPQRAFRVRVVLLDDNKHVTDVGCAFIKEAETLEELHLKQTPITDLGLAYFRGRTAFRVLDLRELNITDEGMANFNGCKQLSRVYLSNTKVGDATMKQLLNVTELTYLDLFQTQVTREGLKPLQDKFPKLMVDYNPGANAPKK